MKGLDTNVLVRYLTQDETRQARKANALIDGAAASGERLAVGLVVLCETVWVLRAAYDCDRALVAEVLERILGVAQFDIEDKQIARLALEAYRHGRGDFADYVIGHRSRRAGCSVTATFDRKLKGSELFEVL